MPRILFATTAGLLGFFAYVAAVLALADTLGHVNWALQLLFFVVAGIAWVLPARWLMLWGAGKR
jgi:hypothetical protein